MAWAIKYVSVAPENTDGMKLVNDAGAVLWEPFAVEASTTSFVRRIWLRREYWIDQNGRHVDKDSNEMQP